MRRIRSPKQRRITSREFIIIARGSIESTLSKGKPCLYFGSFREEGENSEQRCLLAEYPPEEQPYLSERSQFASACRYHDKRIPSHCKLNGMLTREQLEENARQQAIKLEELRERWGYKKNDN